MDPDSNKPVDMLVNHRFADTYFSQENPIGHSVESTIRPGSSNRLLAWWRMRAKTALRSSHSRRFTTADDAFFSRSYILDQDKRDPAATITAVRETIEAVPGRAVYATRPLTEALAERSLRRSSTHSCWASLPGPRYCSLRWDSTV